MEGSSNRFQKSLFYVTPWKSDYQIDVQTMGQLYFDVQLNLYAIR